MGEFDSFKPKQKNKLETNTLFEFYAPSADEVRLAGSFNGWDPAKHRLKKGPDGRWLLNFSLSPGRYECLYLVDGSWENDQRPVQCVSNAFGTWNCVVEVS